MLQALLTVNVGSSSVKLGAFDVAAGQPALLRRATFEFDLRSGSLGDLAMRASAAATQLQREAGIAQWQFVAHRIVHGGALRGEVHRYDAVTRAALEAACDAAPLHNPPALAVLEALAAPPRAARDQLLVLDSGFFDALPAVAQCVALPRDVVDSLDLRRRGYHGLAHRALWRSARQRLGSASAARVLTLQLGAGASIAAIRDGVPAEVSMGYSPLEGLIMNTRSGDLDPAIVLRLLASGRYDIAALDHLLQQQSGLLGLSGHSGDLRDLLQRDDADSQLAVDAYCHRARRHLGAGLATLGGVDTIVFGGGVGEHQPVIRARLLEDFGFAGIRIDPLANERARGVDARISADGSTPVLVAAVDEAHEIALAALTWRSPT
jgi:acetate kinase